MKENLVLLVDPDADSAGLVLEAAARTGHSVRFAKTSRDVFQILKNEIDRLDLIIVDVDPGAHGLALLEAISGYDEKPPVIVLTGLEETYMQSIAAGHGAAGCLGKPVPIEKLKSTLDQISERMSRMQTCDRWGHPYSPPIKKELNRESAFRGIASKMSATTAMKGEDSTLSKLESQPKRAISARAPGKAKSAAIEIEKLTRKYRKLMAEPFPERRKTNKFRESHRRKG